MYTSSDTCSAAPRPLLAALARLALSHKTRDGPSWFHMPHMSHGARTSGARAAAQRAERGQRHGAWGGLLLHVKQREHKMPAAAVTSASARVRRAEPAAKHAPGWGRGRDTSGVAARANQRASDLHDEKKT